MGISVAITVAALVTINNGICKLYSTIRIILA